MDNSIDSAASQIDVELDEGGHKRIAVIDNGHGIHPDDIELSLQRHSTSKLRSQSDLDCITSLGFRGEALASIASVAHFLLTSRIESAESAWAFMLDPVSGGSYLKPASRQRGTTVEVSNVFTATPARRKFMRSQRTEFLHIMDVFKRVACSRFSIGFKLTHNSKIVLRYRPCADDMSERVMDVLGKHFLARAIPVNYTSAGMKLWGWLGDNTISRSQSDRQYCYVNGRVIRDKRIFHGIRSAFDDALPKGRYPLYLLHIDIDPQVTDINVHPAKSEVRFRDPRDVHDFIHTSLRDALKHHDELPGTGDDRPVAERIREQRHHHHPLQVKESHQAYRNLFHRTRQDDLLSGEPHLGRVLVVFANRLALLEREDQIIFADVPAISEYVLTFRLNSDYEAKQIRKRPLLVPVDITVTNAQLQALEDYAVELENAGLSIRAVSKGAVAIKTIPALLEQVDVKNMIRSVLDRVAKSQ